VSGGTDIAAVFIFAATYAVIAIGKLPGFQLDRAGAALLGASLMVGVGVLPLEDAYRAGDFDTITLLLGMMIVVANLRLSGFFRIVSDFVVARAGHPLLLLIAIIMVSGLLSAPLTISTIVFGVWWLWISAETPMNPVWCAFHHPRRRASGLRRGHERAAPHFAHQPMAVARGDVRAEPLPSRRALRDVTPSAANQLAAMPWWPPLAGLTGAVAGFAGLALIDKLGAGMVNGLIITANLATSLAMDQFVLLNSPYTPRTAGD
jgi:hypothetical protein